MVDAGERLLDLAAPPRLRPVRLSVVGLCKNAGKTVTLNHLIRAAARRRIRLGLVGTGRDGEAADALTELPKPRIWVPVGTWVATGARALGEGTAALEVHRELPFTTPFGPMVLARAVGEGEVLLTGPGPAQRIGAILGALESLGAELSLVDGSFDRIAAASPAVTGRLVLAAGAAYSHSMAETVAQVAHLADLFDLPAVPPEREAAVERAAALGPVTVLGPGSKALEVPVESALGDPTVIIDWAAANGFPNPLVVLEGALADRLLFTLVKRRAFGMGLVVEDPTRICVDRRTWRRWRRRGGRVYVRRRAELLAVTANPWSPSGPGYDPWAFWEALRAAAGRPVFDLEANLCAWAGAEGPAAPGAAAPGQEAETEPAAGAEVGEGKVQPEGGGTHGPDAAGG